MDRQRSALVGRARGGAVPAVSAYILEDRPLVTDLLTKLVLGIIALGLVQVVNPFASGGVLANLGGLIFLAVPLLWFFIGRAVGEDRSVALLLKVVVAVALIVGLYGVYQTEWSVGEQLPPGTRNGSRLPAIRP